MTDCALDVLQIGRPVHNGPTDSIISRHDVRLDVERSKSCSHGKALPVR